VIGWLVGWLVGWLIVQFVIDHSRSADINQSEEEGRRGGGGGGGGEERRLECNVRWRLLSVYDCLLRAGILICLLDCLFVMTK